MRGTGSQAFRAPQSVTDAPALTAHIPADLARFLLPSVTGFVTQIWGFCASLMNLIDMA
jgi:hypothetical protein